MSSNSVQIIHQLHRDFQELVEYVTSEESQSRTTYEVELTLFRRLLKLGLQLLRLFFVRPREPAYAPDGTSLKYHNMRQKTYFSVFGKVQSSKGTTSTPQGRKVSVLWMLN